MSLVSNESIIANNTLSPRNEVINTVNIWSFLGDSVNKSQYFNPIFSWFVVTYTYLAVGRNSGSIWKYLFYVTSFGFLANVLVLVKEFGYKSFFYMDYIKYMVWIETYLYGFNEWGFVLINFLKIRSCIPFLKRKFWLVFIYILLIYTCFCRTLIAYYKMDEEYIKYTNLRNKIKNDTTVTQKSTKFHAALYIPIGIVELIFILSVIVEYISETTNTLKKELSALLHSTLFRSLIVSVLYILIAIDVLFEKEGMVDFYRKLLWRIKGMFGIIFLVDLLLLRIDLDTNSLMLQKQELENKKKELAIYSPFDDDKNNNNNVINELNFSIEPSNSLYSSSYGSAGRPLLKKNSSRKQNYHYPDNYNDDYNLNYSIEPTNLYNTTGHSIVKNDSLRNQKFHSFNTLNSNMNTIFSQQDYKSRSSSQENLLSNISIDNVKPTNINFYQDNYRNKSPTHDFYIMNGQNFINEIPNYRRN